MQEKKGYVSFVLHAHLPFIHHPESDDYLEESWLKNELTYEEVKDTLKISDANVHRILKTCTLKNGCYQREDVIRECMGGRLYTLEDLNRGEKV